MKNSSGFSLVELLMVAGIMGLMVAASSTFFVAMQKQISRLNAAQGVNSIAFEIQTATTRAQTCTNALVAGQRFDFAAAQDPSHIGGKWNPDLDAGMDFLYNASGETLTPTPDQDQTMTNYPLRVEFIKLYNAQDAGTDSSGNRLYKVDLGGGFSGKIGDTYLPFAPRIMSSFFVRVQGTQISDCFNIDLNDPNTLADMANYFCSALGGTMNGNNCEGLSNDNIGSCPEGQVLRGVASGTPLCVAQASGPPITPPTPPGGGNSCSFGGRSYNSGQSRVEACNMTANTLIAQQTLTCINGSWVVTSPRCEY